MKAILLIYMKCFIGLPYRWGGENPLLGFDCSGLVCELLKGCGILKGHVQMSSGQLAVFFNASQRQDIEMGDLCFFGKSLQEVTHVALAISPDHMVEAASGDSTTTSLDVAKQQNAFVKIRPIMNRGDFVGAARPPYKD